MSTSIRDQVAVIGVGCTKFGDLYDSTYEDQVCDAAFQAYEDAKIDPSEIDAAYAATDPKVLEAMRLALGAVTGGTSVSSGATLQLLGGVAVGAEALSLSGTGVGDNGALRLVSGIASYGGTVTLAGERVAGPDRRRGVVFQSYSSFPWLNVLDNVKFGLRFRDVFHQECCVSLPRDGDVLVGLGDVRPRRRGVF